MEIKLSKLTNKELFDFLGSSLVLMNQAETSLIEGFESMTVFDKKFQTFGQHLNFVIDFEENFLLVEKSEYKQMGVRKFLLFLIENCLSTEEQ